MKDYTASLLSLLESPMDRSIRPLAADKCTPSRTRSRFLGPLRPFNTFFLILALAWVGGCTDSTGPDPWTEGDLLERLNALPGVRAQEIQPFYGYPRAFQLDITQPVDHNNPNGPTFTQRAYLSHVPENTPMVFAPSGYGTTPESGQELAGILQTNCLSVTHRYFPDARPAVMDWRYLDIRQAAADHHAIVTLLKTIYRGKWLNTGASKGGETVLFHRRFYPEDVDVTVAYVAPLLYSDDDPRFMPFLRSRGTPEERAAVLAFQRMLLERKADLLDDFQAWFDTRGYTLSIPLAATFEEAVASYEWGYWQRHAYSPAQIPGPSASGVQMINHLAAVVRLEYDADVWRDYFSTYVYQAKTEIGLPQIDLSPVADLFTEEEIDTHQAYGFPPTLQFVYRPEVIPDIVQWIQSQGDRILLIYGGDDPWTAGAVELTGATDVLRVIQPGADHQVQIVGLDDRDAVLARLSEWLGIPVSLPVAAPIRAAPQAAEPIPLRGMVSLRSRF